MTRLELWTQLLEAGLVSGDVPAEAEAPSPWPMRAMLGIAGWVGALFLLGFAGAAFSFLFRSEEGLLPAGAVCCFVAFMAFRALPRNDFVAQFAFAVSLAGQALILLGLWKLFGTETSAATYVVMALLEAALAFTIPNYLHRVFTTLAANFCLMIAATMAGAPVLATVVASVGTALIWLSQERVASNASLWEPIGYGCAIALLHLDGSLLIGPVFWQIFFPNDSSVPAFLLWAGPAVVGLVIVYVVWELREHLGVMAVPGAIVFALCGTVAPGISAAVLVLMLGYANSSRALFGLGLLAFGGYLSHFYYQLSATLLMKSIALSATGAALLALWWALKRFVPEPPHA